MDGSKSFKDETHKYSTKTQAKYDELRKACHDGKVAASKEFTVFIPKSHQTRRLPLHMKRGEFWEAHMFLVDVINVVTSATAHHLDSTVMWAMILGKRLVSPSDLASPIKERLTSSCLIKYRTAYTLKELGWWLKRDVNANHKGLCKHFARACAPPDSKWRVLDKTSYDRWQKSKIVRSQCLPC